MKRTLNKPIFLSKGIFLAGYMAGAVLMPFLTLYFEQRDLSGLQIGFLASIPPLMAILGMSIWSGVADATQRHRLIFILTIIGALLSVLLMPVSPGFVTLGLVMALHAFCFMSMVPLIDASALKILGDQPEKYGQIRLWGSIGYGLGGMLIGLAIERLGLGSIFYGHALLLIVVLLIALRLPVAQAKREGGFGQGLRRLLQDRRWYLFLLIIFVGGFGDALIRTYGFLYLNTLGVSSRLMGMSLTIGVVFELAVLGYSSHLIKRFGIRALLLTAVTLQIARLVIWSVITDPYLALALQLANGVTFGGLWVAGVAYAKQIAPPGMETTAQGLLSTVYFGLPSVVGALLGGFWYEQYGATGVYQWGAGVMLAGLIIFIIAGQATAKRTVEQPVT